LFALDDLDTRHILNIHLLFPSKSVGSSRSHTLSIQQTRSKIHSHEGELNMDDWIEAEWRAEAGNMLVRGNRRTTL
jgi:hypothetical protein